MTRCTGYLSIVMRTACIFAMAALPTLFARNAAHGAGNPIVYPAQGQTTAQMEQDKYACYQWAKAQTGFDPMAAPVATAPPPQQQGGMLKGAAGGAALGAIVGAIAGNAGEGAAIGAASGGIFGGMLRRKSMMEQEQYAQQQAANYEQQRGYYNRAWGACMTGKGYSVAW